MSLLIGLDPGSCVTGYGVVRWQGDRIQALDYGCIRLGNGDMAQRLASLHEQVCALMSEHQVEAVAIEKVFVKVNPQSALKLGQARGVLLAAAGRMALSVHEYAPNQIKKALTGAGHADKAHMQAMIHRLLKLPKQPASDAADALACALCHVHNYRYQQLIQQATR